MSEEPARGIYYNDDNYRALMVEYKRLSTFAEVSSWDQRAQAEVDKIIIVIRNLDNEITQQSVELEQVTKAHSEKSFLNRMFSGHKAEKDIAQLIEKCRSHKMTLAELASHLQEATDFTPNSLQEQKALLKELRERKKELQFEKREVATAMKAIRTEARQQSAQAGRVFGIFYDSKVAASQRRRIRYAKESALRPQEDTKSAIERQIAQVDREILWAERFHE
jgi:hypothetical protein